MGDNRRAEMAGAGKDRVGFADLQNLCGIAVLPSTELQGISREQESSVLVASQVGIQGVEFTISDADARRILGESGIARSGYSDTELSFLFRLIIARQSHVTRRNTPGWTVAAMQANLFARLQEDVFESRNAAMRVLKDVLAL